jgi:hypothetical protein
VRTLKFLVLVLAAAVAPRAHCQLENPDFATGMQGWGFRLDAGGGGIVDWDSASGDPAPGSARAGNVFPGSHVDGWKQCVPVSGAWYSVSAQVASAVKDGNSCRIRIDFIANQDCVDGTPIALEVKLGNTRNDGSFETIAASGSLPEGILAAGLFLEHVRAHDAAAGDSFCHFDHVALGGDAIFSAAFE